MARGKIEMARKNVLISIGLLLIGALLIGSLFTSYAQDTGDGEEEITDEMIEAGRELFLANGCFACHGQNAEGTDIGPALAGHSEAAVRRQVRAPLGIMPVYPPDKISDAELDLIAAYITSLPGEHMHMMGSEGLGTRLSMHHWLALFALQDEDVAEARHHVEHIIELVEGEHLVKMQEVLDDLDAGDLDEASHLIQQMLADTGEPPTSVEEMYLQIVLSAVRAEELELAHQELGHFLEIATGEQLELGETIMALLDDEDLAGAQSLLEEMLGALADEHMHGNDHMGDMHDDDAMHDDDHMDDAPNDHGGAMHDDDSAHHH
jgi:mono/diheme cytochrome c family protein